MNLREVGEDRLLASLLPQLRTTGEVVAGAGDDCALVKPPRDNSLIVLKTDCVVEGTHFTFACEAQAVGWKAMMRPLSDFAAVSGVPQHALVTLITPASTEAIWVRKLYRGLGRAAAKFDVSLVGGETSGSKELTAISVTVTGYVEAKRATSRRGGKHGDALFVTGVLGGSVNGHHLRFVPRIAESRWLTEHFDIHAMMDLSDGLGADLPRLAAASGLGFYLDEAAIPRRRGVTVAEAIGDGEDYELLFAVPAGKALNLKQAWRRRFPAVPLTHVGHLDRSGETAISSRGYVHFQEP